MKSYLKFLSRNRLYTAIEVFGMSISLAFVILIFCYARQEFSTVADQPNRQNLYAIGADNFLGMTYSTAPDLAATLPEIEAYTRVYSMLSDVTTEGTYHRATVMAVDSNFFDLFAVRFVSGNRSALEATGNVVLSREFAIAAFGQIDVLGRTVVFKMSSGNDVPLTVSAVVDNFDHSIFNPFDMMINIENQDFFAESVFGSHDDMFGSVNAFLLLPDGVDRAAFAGKMYDMFKEKWKTFASDTFLFSPQLVRLDEIYFSDLRSSNIQHGNRSRVEILLLAALILLISALFNYINLTVAQTGFRAKEMASRRLFGASKQTILWKYVGESFLFTTLCFVLGFFIALCAAQDAGRLLDTKLSVWQSGVSNAAFFVALIVLISVVSALLPVMFVSRFKPIDVVRGNFRFRSKMVFGKCFIVLQNIISIVLIAMAVTMQVQMRYLVNRPKGYNTRNVMLIDASTAFAGEGEKVVDLASRIRQLPLVKSVGIANGTPLQAGGQYLLAADDKEVLLRMAKLDSTAFRIFGLKVIESFTDPVEWATYYTVDAMTRMGLTKETFTNVRYFDGSASQFIAAGVIENYNYGSPLYDSKSWTAEGEVNCVAIISDKQQWIGQIVVETTDDHDAALKAVGDVCHATVSEYKGIPIELNLQYADDWQKEQLAATRCTMTIITAFMVLSILISALGLLAMSVYYTRQRSKEIAVRKVYGSTTGEVVGRLSRGFMWLVAVAVVIALPLSVYAVGRYLQTFTYRIDAYAWIFVVAVAVSVLIALLAILDRVVRAANANPIDTLKKE